MLLFFGFLITFLIFGLLALTIHGFISAGRKTPLSNELFNFEMFAEQEPVLAEVPKRAVADTHWHVKAFMRPRRKG